MHKALKRYSPIFVLPTLLAFIIGFIVPFAQGLYLSFCKFTTVDNAKWVGVANYNVILKDASFLNSFKFTILFAEIPRFLPAQTALRSRKYPNRKMPPY
jgi:raffinose/stachyose/melibiose transport system permease protein